jgi:hypothetical protein
MPAENDVDLRNFVREALRHGVSRADIDEVLLNAGWSSKQIRTALDAFAEPDFPIPVPKPRPYRDARETFMHLALFTMLYFTAFNLASLMFRLIDRSYADAEIQAVPIKELIRFPLSCLTVTIPVLLYVSYLIRRDTRLDPTRRINETRRQLTYITLFVAAAILIVTLTVVVYSFLGDELTPILLRKVIALAGITIIIFVFYMRDLRIGEKVPGKKDTSDPAMPLETR